MYYICIFIDDSQEDLKEIPELASGRTSYETDSSLPVCDPLPDSSRSSSTTSILQQHITENRSAIADAAVQLAASLRSSSSVSPTTTITTISDTIHAPDPISSAIDNTSRLSDVINTELNALNTTSPTISVDSSTGREPSESPPTSLPQVLRDVAAMSSFPVFAQPLLEMGFSQRHVGHALQATGTRQGSDTRRINELVTWLLEHPVSDDEVSLSICTLITRARDWTRKPTLISAGKLPITNSVVFLIQGETEADDEEEIPDLSTQAISDLELPTTFHISHPLEGNFLVQCLN